jgi:hypothetical protein
VPSEGGGEPVELLEEPVPELGEPPPPSDSGLLSVAPVLPVDPVLVKFPVVLEGLSFPPPHAANSTKKDAANSFCKERDMDVCLLLSTAGSLILLLLWLVLFRQRRQYSFALSQGLAAYQAIPTKGVFWLQQNAMGTLLKVCWPL